MSDYYKFPSVKMSRIKEKGQSWQQHSWSF